MPEVRKVDTDYDYKQIAKERLVWVVKPIFLVSMVTWCLHPSTTHRTVIESNIQLGFILGAFFGLFIYRKELLYYLVTRRQETRNRKNRIPDEYYFGRIKEIMQEERK